MKVVMHIVWKKCPECGYGQSKYYIDHKKVGEDIDYSDIEKSTVTYQEYKYFICMGKKCGHRWREK